MTLQQLVYVVTIADKKSMNQAAGELFISQPALSNAIHDLEKELNIEIFHRTNRGIVVTTEGAEFLSYARQMLELQELMEERFIQKTPARKKFSVSMQHYSFAVEAFIRLAREFQIEEYELAVHETKTGEVIENVRNRRSELGILYVNEFNKKAIFKILAEDHLEFQPLFDCPISVYLSKTHPLAMKEKITFEELQNYPSLIFEQGDQNSLYFSEEVFSNYLYRQSIHADDRATMLNLMVGLNGFTLCSGIICEELNGGNYVSVPLETDQKMTIGYIKQKKIPLSILGRQYLEILQGYEPQA